MIPTAEQLLSNLPTAIVVWTAITLCWGLYVHLTYSRARHAIGRIGIVGDNYNTYCTIFANGVLASFLLLEPLFVNYMDMIIVVNVFYNVYLAYATYSICAVWSLVEKVESQSTGSVVDAADKTV